MSAISAAEMNKRIAVQQRLIGEMQQMGADLTQPTDVCHLLAFPSRQIARHASERLEIGGFHVTTLDEDVGGDWLVFASNEQLLNDRYLALVRISMERLAAEFGGRYDDWEAAIRVDGWPDCGCAWPES
jgi:hypothetical protein